MLIKQAVHTQSFNYFFFVPYELMKCIVQHVLHVCTVLCAHMSPVLCAHMSHKHLELHILLTEEDCLSVPFLGHYMHVCVLEGFPL